MQSCRRSKPLTAHNEYHPYRKERFAGFRSLGECYLNAAYNGNKGMTAAFNLNLPSLWFKAKTNQASCVSQVAHPRYSQVVDDIQSSS